MPDRSSSSLVSPSPVALSHPAARPRRSTAAAGVLLALFLVLTAAVPAAAAPDFTRVAGAGLDEWSAAWWQWVFSQSAPNPQLAQGELDCGRNQSGAVWFLAGAPAGVTAERSCTVPRGKHLFFPVFNAIFLNEAGENASVADKRTALDGFLSDLTPGILADFGFPGSRACDLEVILDGEPLTFRVPESRVQSVPFRADTGDGSAGFTPGVVDPEAVTDGFWMLLPPLAPGGHTLSFGGRLCELDSFADHPLFPPVRVTYQLTVVDGATGSLEGLSNLEIIQALYTAFAVGDGETILEILDPDVVWIESEGIPYGGTFIGRDAVFAGVFANIAAEWDGFTATVDEMFEADGERVIVRQRDGGTYKATGKSMEAEAISIWTLDGDGRVIQFRQVIDTQEVMSAVLP